MARLGVVLETGRAPDLAVHVARGEKTRIGGVDERDVGGNARRLVEERLEAHVAPHPAALLDQPPAGHVPEEPDPSGRTLFVRQAGDAGRGGGVGFGLFPTDEEPGAAGHEDMVDRAAGGDGRRGVVTRDEVHGDPPPGAHGGRRFANRREQRGVEPDGVGQLVRPLPGAEIEQARRTGAGALAHDLAREVVHEQLGEHEHVRGAPRAARGRARRAGRSC